MHKLATCLCERDALKCSSYYYKNILLCDIVYYCDNICKYVRIKPTLVDYSLKHFYVCKHFIFTDRRDQPVIFSLSA